MKIAIPFESVVDAPLHSACLADGGVWGHAHDFKPLLFEMLMEWRGVPQALVFYGNGDNGCVPHMQAHFNMWLTMLGGFAVSVNFARSLEIARQVHDASGLVVCHRLNYPIGPDVLGGLLAPAG